MKTTIAISAVLVAALAACADKPPPREPTTSNNTTTTSTTYPTYQPQASAQEPVSSYGPETPTSTTSVGPFAEPNAGSGTVKQTPLAPPAEPAPVTAKSPDGKSPTAAAATDQGNSKSEVQTVAAIRKRMVASKTLSFGAKNATVITQGAKCTLRGTVKSDAERSEIEGIARNTDGITEVDNQLVVKQ